ncbi:hypothetical protein AB4851_12535 [Burkholderia sp. 22PA0099]|uniref:hypothetical protein n=1 Tax=Burkholderia sp. 22PA0099 TaxID=3237372 RepID=UPI0039C2D22B
MAPLTRMRAYPAGDMPTAPMLDHDTQCAIEGGLIVGEADCGTFYGGEALGYADCPTAQTT